MKVKINVKGEMSREALSCIESIESKDIYIKENTIVKNFIRNLKMIYNSLIDSIGPQKFYFNNVFNLVSADNTWVSEHKWFKYFQSNTGIVEFIKIGFQILDGKLVVDFCRENLADSDNNFKKSMDFTYDLPSECNPVKCFTKIDGDTIIFNVKEYTKDYKELELSPSNKIATQLAFELYHLFFIQNAYAINIKKD